MKNDYGWTEWFKQLGALGILLLITVGFVFIPLFCIFTVVRDGRDAPLWMQVVAVITIIYLVFGGGTILLQQFHLLPK